MASLRSIRIVGLVARPAGLATVRGLVESGRPIEFAAIFTHRRLPRSEDPLRGERPEYGEFVALAREIRAPFYSIDDRAAAERLEGLESCRPFDILLSVNWRYRVVEEFLSWPTVAAINLHRGRLPEYAGAEPVRRALEAGERAVTLTAHWMTAALDSGPVLIEHEHEVGGLRGLNLIDDVERVKRELVPLYPIVALRAIQCALSYKPSGCTEAMTGC